MFYKNKFTTIIPIIICCIIAMLTSSVFVQAEDGNQNNNKDYIKWVKFNIPSDAMEKALKADIENKDSEHKISPSNMPSSVGGCRSIRCH